MKTQELIELKASITQGEWRQSQADPLTVLTGLGDNQTTLARVFRPCLGESKHDAKAISLVPQLLSEVITLRNALQQAIEWSKEVPAPYREFPFIVSARAALANARSVLSTIN